MSAYAPRNGISRWYFDIALVILTLLGLTYFVWSLRQERPPIGTRPIFSAGWVSSRDNDRRGAHWEAPKPLRDRHGNAVFVDVPRNLILLIRSDSVYSA